MEIRYKIYEMVKTTIEERQENFEPIKRFIVEEATINDWGCGFDSFEEAAQAIANRGDHYINYTILPYVYMT